jgi:hypothetical protein
MRPKLTPVLLLVVFSLGFGLTTVGAEAEPVNLTGTWAVQYMGSQGPIKMTFVFKQTGEKLTGDYSGPFGPYKVRGIIKGKQVVFGWEQEGNGGITFTVAFKGAIESATRMTGTVGNPFCGSEPCGWTAARKSMKTRNSAVPSPTPGQSPKLRPRAQ